MHRLPAWLKPGNQAQAIAPPRRKCSAWRLLTWCLGLRDRGSGMVLHGRSGTRAEQHASEQAGPRRRCGETRRDSSGVCGSFHPARACFPRRRAIEAAARAPSALACSARRVANKGVRPAAAPPVSHRSHPGRVFTLGRARPVGARGLHFGQPRSTPRPARLSPGRTGHYRIYMAATSCMAAITVPYCGVSGRGPRPGRPTDCIHQRPRGGPSEPRG